MVHKIKALKKKKIVVAATPNTMNINNQTNILYIK